MTSTRNKFLRTGLAGVAMSALAVATAPVASAHDSVVDSSPARDSVEKEFPAEIELTFSGNPRDEYNTFAVSNADSGEILFSGEPELDGADLTIKVPEDVRQDAKDGKYTVGYQITSSDGHATKGRVDFSVESGEEEESSSSSTSESAAAGESTTAEADATTDSTSDSAEAETGASSDSGVLKWVFGIVGILVIGGALIMAIARLRNSK